MHFIALAKIPKNEKTTCYYVHHVLFVWLQGNEKIFAQK